MLQNTMLSLYDYLGRAAGSTLGKQVADCAKKKKIKSQKKKVNFLMIFYAQKMKLKICKK